MVLVGFGWFWLVLVGFGGFGGFGWFWLVQVMSPHHSDQMSQRSQDSRIAL